jgi:hypothetical protein
MGSYNRKSGQDPKSVQPEFTNLWQGFSTHLVPTYLHVF